ncbi:hypothetical protein VNI00_018560 [Paramarasmius palmivorus]|uniref:Uncharacterized protein n=1 Tax=Paramarasmius palmivorus TaxID=297713 RepID=A0AAW0AWK8_9AGAR
MKGAPPGNKGKGDDTLGPSSMIRNRLHFTFTDTIHGSTLFRRDGDNITGGSALTLESYPSPVTGSFDISLATYPLS